MRVHILFEFKDGSWGGGNQFLKSLKKYLQSADVYEPAPAKADVILFNSHQSIIEVARFKLKCPGKLFVHRIDGPMRLYNKMSDKRDDIVFTANKYLADATIFQSDWSQQQNYRLGLHQKSFETTIPNAPEPTIFNRMGKIPFSTQRKVRLIATSWSQNWTKGFDVYQWLDNNLDFDRYEMTFVGRSPLEFKNIRHILPVNSEQLSQRLKNSDIFVIASQSDPCSNSLIEALHCGLPAIGLRDGGHTRIISQGGESFSKPDEIPALLEKITADYHSYQANIKNPSMEEVGKRYYDFITEVWASKQRMESYGWMNYIRVKAEILKWRLSECIGDLVGWSGEQK
jgi:glycosyltransferase involved in cell wall biosynthesis